MTSSNNPKVLGICGSPRRDGNTEILIDEILRGAEEEGASVEKVVLNELELNPCNACNHCIKNGVCIHEDDMVDLYEKMKSSEVWVLGTPIYWWGPTAQFKIFLDRWYGAKQVKFRGKHVILAIPLGGGHPTYARHTVGLLTDVLNYLNMELFETVLAPGINRLGAVRSHSDIMQKAYNTGKEVIKKMGKKLKT